MFFIFEMRVYGKCLQSRHGIALIRFEILREIARLPFSRSPIFNHTLEPFRAAGRETDRFL